MSEPREEGGNVYKRLIDGYALLLDVRGKDWLEDLLVQYATQLKPPIPRPRAWAEQVVSSVHGRDEAAFSRLFGPAMYNG